ncbi:MAG: hypothetical protein ACXWOX_09680 [Ktedonobacteraceae bacterium]
MPQTTTEPQAKHTETATLNQSTMAVETAAGSVLVPDFARRCVRGGGCSRDDEAGEAPLEHELCAVGSGEALVLRGDAQAGCSATHAGLPDQSLA